MLLQLPLVLIDCYRSEELQKEVWRRKNLRFMAQKQADLSVAE